LISESVECRQLFWRCRRGMKELDVVLERFARAELPAMSEEERQAFAQFLDLPDPVMLRYLLGHETPAAPELARFAQLITSPRI
jgi:antitoxin CptB